MVRKKWLFKMIDYQVEPIPITCCRCGSNLAIDMLIRNNVIFIILDEKVSLHFCDICLKLMEMENKQRGDD
jgi:hypothetical protein